MTPNDPRQDRPDDRSDRHDPDHWSHEVKDRVRAQVGGDAGSPEAAGPGSKPAVSAVRARVEARLKETEEARHVEKQAEDAPEPALPVGVPDPPLEEVPPLPADPDESEWPEEEPGPPPLATLIATCGGIGRIRPAPGTFGSLAAVAAFAVTQWMPANWQLVLVGLAVVVAWWAAHRYAAAIGEADPDEVVVDEFAGMWLALVATSPDWMTLAGAFLVFRILDIAKPPPVRWAERLPGGLGIMADDLVAGAVVRGLVYVFFAM